MEPVLLFDGDCGFCTRTLGWLRLVDRRQLIDTMPYQRPGAPDRLGLTREQCAESVRWRGADGSDAAGAAAISAALAVALGSEWPERLYRRTAGGQERLYGWVAANRHRLPGVTPWCTRHPRDCAPSSPSDQSDT